MKPNWKRRARKARAQQLNPKPTPPGTAEYLNDDPETHVVILKDHRGTPRAMMPESVYFALLSR